MWKWIILAEKYDMMILLITQLCFHINAGNMSKNVKTIFIFGDRITHKAIIIFQLSLKFKDLYSNDKVNERSEI